MLLAHFAAVDVRVKRRIIKGTAASMVEPSPFSFSSLLPNNLTYPASTAAAAMEGVFRGKTFLAARRALAPNDEALPTNMLKIQGDIYAPQNEWLED